MHKTNQIIDDDYDGQSDDDDDEALMVPREEDSFNTYSCKLGYHYP